MNCGSCLLTDGCCYTSMPPKVKCTITNEYHLYGDECNCDEARISKEAELEQFKEKFIDQPICAEILNCVNDLPNITFSDGELLKYEYTGWQVGTLATEAVSCTRCLACDETIILNRFEGVPKICSDCRKVIKFIKEKFSKDLEVYENEN